MFCIAWWFCLPGVLSAIALYILRVNGQHDLTSISLEKVVVGLVILSFGEWALFLLAGFAVLGLTKLGTKRQHSAARWGVIMPATNLGPEGRCLQVWG